MKKFLRLVWKIVSNVFWNHSGNFQYKRVEYSMYRDDREMYKIKCSECGNDAEVPFKPDGERPVYCRDCYRAKRPRRDRY